MGVHLVPRHSFGVTLCTLTPDLAHRLRGDAFTALNGDGSCSLSNMNSCFASEYCHFNEYPSAELHHMCSSEIALIAVSDVESDGCTPCDTRFAGCISANPPGCEMVRQFPFVQGSLLISNFCVDSKYRGCGIGKKLFEETLARCEDRKRYLRVMKNSSNPNLETVFRDRVTRLLRTYEKLDFEVVAECPEYYILGERGEGKR